MLLLAALAEGTTRLTGVLDSDDTRVMRGALEACGTQIEEQGDAENHDDDRDQAAGGSRQGDVAKAKQLLADAGYPNGLTLNYVGSSTGYGPAFTTAVQRGISSAMNLA